MEIEYSLLLIIATNRAFPFGIHTPSIETAPLISNKRSVRTRGSLHLPQPPFKQHTPYKED